MEQDIENLLKLIEDKTSNALNIITKLQKKLSTADSNDKKVLNDECISLIQKITTFENDLKEFINILKDFEVTNKDI